MSLHKQLDQQLLTKHIRTSFKFRVFKLVSSYFFLGFLCIKWQSTFKIPPLIIIFCLLGSTPVKVYNCILNTSADSSVSKLTGYAFPDQRTDTFSPLINCLFSLNNYLEGLSFCQYNIECVLTEIAVQTRDQDSIKSLHLISKW